MRSLSKKVPGAPGQPRSARHWPVYRKPFRLPRSIRTLIKVDQSEGRTMPEFKNTLNRAGVGSPKGAKTIVRQRPVTPPSFSTRPGKMVPTPSPTNREGVKNPYKEK